MCTELTSARLSGALSSLKLAFLTFRLSLTQLTSPDVALLYLKLSLGASSSHISHSLSSPEGYQIFSSHCNLHYLTSSLLTSSHQILIHLIQGVSVSVYLR